MSKAKRRMTVTLDIDEWVLLRNLIGDYVEEHGYEYGNEPFNPNGVNVAEMQQHLTDCIDDFHDLH